MSQRDEDIRAFIDLVEGWNTSGWGEYLLWETLTGQRERPFRLVEQPLSQDERAILARLRDEHCAWPFWNEEGNEWRVAPIDAWKQHASIRSADDVLSELHMKSEMTHEPPHRRG